MKTATWKSHDLLLGSGFTYQVFFSSAVESPLRLGCIIIMIFTYYLYIYIYIYTLLYWFILNTLLLHFVKIDIVKKNDYFICNSSLYVVASYHFIYIYIYLYVFHDIPLYVWFIIIYYSIIEYTASYYMLVFSWHFVITTCLHYFVLHFLQDVYIYIYIQIYTNIHSVIIYCIIFWAMHHHMMLLCLRLFCVAILCFAMILHLHCIAYNIN